MQTGLSAWVLAIVRALEDRKIDHAGLLRGLGMDADRLGDVNYRYSQEQVTSLWVASIKATNDANFGLKVAQYIRPSTFHVVGHAMSCSATLRKASERFAHYARLISDSAAVEFASNGNDCLLTVDLHTGGRPAVYQTIDTILAGFLRLCEWIQMVPITPVEVTFRHPQPEDDRAYRDMFRCQIRYNHNINSIRFRTADLERPIPAANEELAMLLDEMAANYLAERFSSRFSQKVNDVLIRQLYNGEPNKHNVSRLLGMTERTLLRRLREENTTFQELLDRLREKLAFDYLRRADLTIEKIAQLLGFASSSAFSRAFVRWTGQRPSDWRNGHPKLGTDRTPLRRP